MMKWSPLKVLGLFSGIGGFTLGMERTKHYQTIRFVECGKYQQKVLTKHWPDIPISSDITKFDGHKVYADVITGGFPCQPFSTAAHGHHTAVDFWPEMLRVIKEMTPLYVIAENVTQGAIVKAQQDIEEIGNYATTVLKISASDCTAPHRRTRWWLCAYPHMCSEYNGTIYAETQKLPQLCKDVWGSESLTNALRVSDGVPYRLDRLKCLGNSVVPYIPQVLGEALFKIHKRFMRTLHDQIKEFYDA